MLLNIENFNSNSVDCLFVCLIFDTSMNNIMHKIEIEFGYIMDQK